VQIRGRFSGEVREGISRMKTNRNDNRIDTSFRELMALASDLAFEYSSGTRDAYKLTRQAFVEILKNSLPRNKSINWHFPGNKYLH
jgi:hypothetical protein